MMISNTSTSTTVTRSSRVSIWENTPIRSTIRPPGPPAATSTPLMSNEAERSLMASTVSRKAGSAGSPDTSANTYMVVPSGDTRPNR